jgi:hypothetical protein
VVNIGTVGTIFAGIDMLREVLEKSGIDKSKATQIAGEFLSRLRSRGSQPASGQSGPEGSAAFSEEVWEYRVLTLGYHKPRRGVKRLVVKMVDDASAGEKEPLALSAALNEVAEDRWEVLTAVGGEAAPTLVLRRERR